MANQQMNNQNQNPQQNRQNPKQTNRGGQTIPSQNASRTQPQQPDSTGAADQQRGTPQHTPGQSSQPKNARQFQSSETNLEEDQFEGRNLDVDQDEDDLSRPRQ